MKVLITGANGQVGRELQRTAPPAYEVTAMNRGDLDITDSAAVTAAMNRIRPQWVINAAAYTAVDRAEQEREAAFAVNAHGAGNVARAAAQSGARMVQISTDFVFDGTKSRPYLPEDTPNPINVYGASKLEGERQVAEFSDGEALILRTAWVYSVYGNNFVKTVLRLLKERDQIEIVVDQVGSPTWARGLAHTIWRAIEKGLSGIHHWTDSGVASWYDFAAAIEEEARILGLSGGKVTVSPICTEDYPTLARRPPYSVLAKKKTCAALDSLCPHWRSSLRNMLLEV